jgi:hypothetical protein
MASAAAALAVPHRYGFIALFIASAALHLTRLAKAQSP